MVNFKFCYSTQRTDDIIIYVMHDYYYDCIVKNSKDNNKYHNVGCVTIMCFFSYDTLYVYNIILLFIFLYFYVSYVAEKYEI